MKNAYLDRWIRIAEYVAPCAATNRCPLYPGDKFLVIDATDTTVTLDGCRITNDKSVTVNTANVVLAY